LGELRDQLENVSDLAEQIRREPLSNPVMLLISPQQSAPADGIGLTILGSDFQRGMTRHAVKLVFFEDDSVQKLENDTPPVIPSDDVDVRSENGLVAFFNLTDAQPGTYSIEVTNPDGGIGLLEGAFQITGAGPGGPNGNGGAVAATKAAKRAKSRGADGHKRGAIARAVVKRRAKS
jgi:hypothetical protein